MRVRLVAFATAARALGASERECEVAAGTTVGDLPRLLAAEAPALAGEWSRFAIAVDGDLAPADRTLADGCEVALLPPVSGG
jgi:molybdopterin synthase sulfur carrier subunit